MEDLGLLIIIICHISVITFHKLSLSRIRCRLHAAKLCKSLRNNKFITVTFSFSFFFCSCLSSVARQAHVHGKIGIIIYLRTCVPLFAALVDYNQNLHIDNGNLCSIYSAFLFIITYSILRII